MFHHFAYNLRIDCDFVLPDLPVASTGGDVEIRVATVTEECGERVIDWFDSGSLSVATFCFPEAGRFAVKGGHHIAINKDPRSDVELLGLYVQGMMLAAVLHQRGFFVLHASVVQFGDKAVAFVGPMGAGKSTVAAALHARGLSVAADDNAAIQLGAGVPLLIPGFPSLKLYPAIAGILGYDQATLRPTHRSQSKKVQSVSQGFSAEPIQLDRIYSLDAQATVEPTRLSALDSMIELIRHSAPTRWGVRGNKNHLRMCADLARVVPIYKIRTFELLSEVVPLAARIEDHCA